MASLGDTIYRGSSLWKRLVGNTATTRKVLCQTGTGAASAAPTWEVLAVQPPVSVTLNDAQIKTLPSASVQILAAPGSGLYIAWHSIELQTKFSGGAYTNVNTTYAVLAAQLVTGGGQSILIANDSTTDPANALLSSFVAAASKRIRLVPYLEAIGNITGYSDYVQSDGVGGLHLLSDMDNQALTLTVDNNGSGNWTGGHAANTLTAVIQYSLVAMP